jgi:hypothetical protein
VLALRGGQPVGQASPGSFIQYRDGDQVSGIVEGFSVTGGQDEIEVVNSSGGTVADTGLSALSGLTQYASFLESGTIDSQRRKAYAEVYDSARGVSLLYTVDMATGAVTGRSPSTRTTRAGPSPTSASTSPRVMSSRPSPARKGRASTRRRVPAG